jgi:hypothetical protein
MLCTVHSCLTPAYDPQPPQGDSYNVPDCEAK